MAVKTITTSLRFNDDDLTHLSRTPASAGNQKRFTWSSWIKRGNLGAAQTIFNPVNAGNEDQFLFTASDTIRFYIDGTVSGDITTTAVYRDPAAWYHIVLAVDTDNAVAADRAIIYVNGVRQAVTTGTTFALGASTDYNRAAIHYIGRYGVTTSQYFDGYMAEVHFLDGQALTANDFGELDANNEWQPKVTSFTSSQYGLNGFYLSFVDGTTAQTLGLDTAPTGTGHTAANNWTTFNFQTLKTSQIEIITNGIHLPTTNIVNQNTNNFVAWHWKKGVTPGFDIVTGAATALTGTLSVAHSLGRTPGMVIAKNTAYADAWYTWHAGLANNGNTYVALNSTAASTTSTGIFGTGHTSTHVNFGQSNWFASIGQSVIAYVWAEVPGFSRFGSYTGNGSADGPFVWCGFRPRWLMFKRSDTTASWYILDAGRSLQNPTLLELYGNLTNVEAAATATVDFISNGFKLRITDAQTNASGGTYLFAAFAEKPFKYARAR